MAEPAGNVSSLFGDGPSGPQDERAQLLHTGQNQSKDADTTDIGLSGSSYAGQDNDLMSVDAPLSTDPSVKAEIAVETDSSAATDGPLASEASVAIDMPGTIDVPIAIDTPTTTDTTTDNPVPIDGPVARNGPAALISKATLDRIKASLEQSRARNTTQPELSPDDSLFVAADETIGEPPNKRKRFESAHVSDAEDTDEDYGPPSKT